MIRELIAIATVLVGFVSSPGVEPSTVTIALAGDSTVTDTSGWGLAFAKLVGPKATVVNFARGGQSSKSFRDSGNWKKVLDTKPQWVLIQFGHNDQPGKGPERETDPETTYRENLAKCIDEARAAGIKPVLVTSLARRVFEADGKLRTDLEPYAEAVRAVAAEKKVPFVDLHVRSKALCEKLGPRESEGFGPPHPKLKGKVDGTHLNEKGAGVFAAIVAEEVKASVPELGTLLK